MKYLALCVGLLAVVTLVLALEVAAWRECLADHSWFYCLRVLGH